MFWKKKKDKDKSGTWGKTARTGKWRSTKSLKDKLDRVFSMYIRLRDSKEFGFKYFRCISCGRVLPFEQADCGHYISRTNMALRFSEDNCSAQCRSCNRFKDGNILDDKEDWRAEGDVVGVEEARDEEMVELGAGAAY